MLSVSLGSKWWMGAALALVGCASNVAEGGSGAASGQGGGGSGGGGPAALALVTSNPSLYSPCWYADDTPPGAAFLLVANRPIACTQPVPKAISTYLPQVAPGGVGPPCVSDGLFVWEVCVPLPPSSVEPGTTDLEVPALDAAEEYLSNSNEGCAFELLVLNHGTLEVLAAGPSSVTFTLAGTDQASGWGPMITSDGKYSALRCP